jgi:hypothetical protein
VEHAREEYEVSERRACRVVKQWRGTQRYLPLRRTDEDQLTQAILALAVKYGRYGYRRITALLQNAGWAVGKDRVQRIWRREGLKVPQKQRPRGRLWLGDGSCVRLRPERANHVWSYDFVKAMTNDGRALRILVVIDEYTRECLALRVARRLGSLQVIDTLADVMLVRGIAAIIKQAHAAGWRPQFLTVSFVGTEEFIKEAGPDAEGTIITQVVPPYDRTDYPTVALYQKSLTKYYPSTPPSFVIFEGFVDAMVIVEGLKRAGKDLTREEFIRAIESIHNMNFGLGPRLVLDYSAMDHKGFEGVYPTVVRTGKPVLLTARTGPRSVTLPSCVMTLMLCA